MGNGSVRGLVIDAVSLQPAMNAARVIKTAWEIAAIRRANAVSSAAHKSVLTRLKRMSNEREIEAMFRGFCLAVGAKKTAYATIAGSGPNAATLHYDANNEPLAGRQMVVLDAGAEWQCYASDVTRTLPIGGKFTKEGKAIYGIVEKMQESCIKAVRPGVPFGSLHFHAMVICVTELLKLGILKGGSAAEILSKGTGAAFFPHGLGHHIGLEVHDVSGRERLMSRAAMVLEKDGAPVMMSQRRGGAGKRDWVTPEIAARVYHEGLMGGYAESKMGLLPGMVVTVEPGM